MNKFTPLALLATATTLAAIPTAVFAAETTQPVQAVAEEVATLEVNAGKMLYGPKGRRIASIYRVTSEGDPQVILNGRMITVPASTLTDVDGKVTTSLSKRDLSRSR